MTEKTLIWGMGIRIFHVLLIAGFAGAFVTSSITGGLFLHLAFGYGILSLVLFRILYGLFGPGYSKFFAFEKPGLSNLIKYGKSLLHTKECSAGHNSASSLFILLFLFGVLVLSVSGIMLLGSSQEAGPLSFMQKNPYIAPLHTVSAYTLLLLDSVNPCSQFFFPAV